MNSTNKINVLVIPDLFPKFKGDVQGIFVLDYLTSTSPYCNNTVMFGRLTSNKKGTSFVNNDDYDLYRFSMSSKKVPFYLKPFYYLLWFIKADAVLTVSNHLKDEILKTEIHPKHIIVSYNPVDTDLFKLKSNQFNKTMLFVGRLDNFKGALRCLEAFDRMNEKFPDWKFTIVGDGEDYQPILNYLNNKPALKSKVKLTGQLSKSEIAFEMQHSDFLVFPSKHESFGLVITEALSSGLPVIVGNTTAPIEFVNSENGKTVQFDDINAIANAIENMI